MQFLIIQTAFLGDVVLATALAEKLHRCYPEARIDFLVRKGNESLLSDHPFLRNVLIWNKKQHKYKNLWQLLKQIRKTRYDEIINLQRFFNSGLLTVLGGSKATVGFDKNPFSFLYSKTAPHRIGTLDKPGKHEIVRCLALVAHFTDGKYDLPKLYPPMASYHAVKHLQTTDYVCVAPTSVWFTKQWPAEKWSALINLVPATTHVYLLGAASDEAACITIKQHAKHPLVTILAGKLSLLESAALMENATMNYVNDSAPLHIATAMRAPVSAIFCSTIPQFGFGPVLPNGQVFETSEKLDCRPCGLHGHAQCPEGHFKCAWTINPSMVVGSVRPE